MNSIEDRPFPDTPEGKQAAIEQSDRTGEDWTMLVNWWGNDSHDGVVNPDKIVLQGIQDGTISSRFAHRYVQPVVDPDAWERAVSNVVPRDSGEADWASFKRGGGPHQDVPR